jgi:hypothetical protein
MSPGILSLLIGQLSFVGLDAQSRMAYQTAAGNKSSMAKKEARLSASLL